ncbi:MAG: SHOCT domain-containing protein, partial [Bacteroidota bacterium]
MMNEFGHGWGMGFGWLIGLVVIILIVAFIVRTTQNRGKIQSPETPFDILKERYARGEINKEEFEAMKRDLES